MQTKIHIGEEIQQQLIVQERSVPWLAKKIGCDPSNLYKQLKCPHLHSQLLYRISVALNVDFFTHYSERLSDEIHGKNYHETG